MASMLLRRGAAAASRLSPGAAGKVPHQSPAAAQLLPQRWQQPARAIYADPQGKSYERQGLVMTRIVCTIGPSSENQEIMQGLADEGMKIGRLNFSHAVKYEEMTEKLNTFRSVKGAHRRVGIEFNLRGALLDTKGPEIRTGSFEGGHKSVEIAAGAEIVLTTDPAFKDKCTAQKVYVDYEALGRTVKKGGTILMDDGVIKLEVLEPVARSYTGEDPMKPYTETLCVVRNKNPVQLGARKGTNIPGAVLDLPALTERDKRDLEWGVANDVDFVAASFIRKASDVRSVIVYLERLMTKLKPYEANPRLVRPVVISKIENAEAVLNFDEILAESDGIMVARGDLGVEIPYQDVFTAQKEMVKKCNEAGKPVIVATQMLDSMMRNPRPTRAEVSDVGNAVLDGADCVMLSGETAAGKYPVESVQAMRKCVVRADQTIDHVGDDQQNVMDPFQILKRARNFTSVVRTSRPGLTSEELETVALCTVVAASELKADLIIVLTTRGNFARAVAKHRPQIPVMVFCSELKVARQLQLFRGLFPVLPPNLQGATVEDIPEAIRTAKEIGWVKAGDKVVVSNYELWEDAGIKQSMNLRCLQVH